MKMYDVSKYYNNDKLYAIRVDLQEHVTIGEKMVGAITYLDLKQLRNLNSFLGTIIREYSYIKTIKDGLRGKLKYYGTDPKLYLMYSAVSNKLTIGRYDDDDIATLNIKEIKEFKTFISISISKLTFADKLPF